MKCGKEEEEKCERTVRGCDIVQREDEEALRRAHHDGDWTRFEIASAYFRIRFMAIWNTERVVKAKAARTGTQATPLRSAIHIGVAFKSDHLHILPVSTYVCSLYAVLARFRCRCH